jgi:hypothetical protein
MVPLSKQASLLSKPVSRKHMTTEFCDSVISENPHSILSALRAVVWMYINLSANADPNSDALQDMDIPQGLAFLSPIHISSEDGHRSLE